LQDVIILIKNCKMKKITFLIVLFLFVGIASSAQVTLGLGQVDNFEDGTVQGWIEGGSSPNPPTNQSTGGPNGVGDHFLQNISSGSGGAGSRMIMFNQTQWQGNYISAGITFIHASVRNSSASATLHLRCVFILGTAMSGTAYASTIAVDVAAGSGWQQVTFPISISDMTLVQATDTYSNTMTGVNIFRILSSASPSIVGDKIAATLDIDDIQASDNVLAVPNLELQNAIVLHPNPSFDMLSISTNLGYQIKSINVFDMLGKLVLSNNTSSTIDISKLTSGQYVVKVITNKGVITKKIVKN